MIDRATLFLIGLVALPGMAQAAPVSAPTPAPAHAPAPVVPPAPAKPAPLRDAEAKLATATDSREARTQEQRAEQLRQHGVSPTAQLLMRDAQHALEQHDLKTAVASMDDALVLQPDAEILWRSRAQLRADQGDFAGAVADLAQATTIDPGDIIAWTMLSDTEADHHDAAAAFNAYGHVMALDPLIENGRKHLDALRISRDGQPL